MTSNLLKRVHQKECYSFLITRRSTMARIILGALTFVLLLAFLPGATAEEVVLKPEEVKVSTPVYRPDFSPALGTYTYEVSWQGIPAAEVKVGVEREGLSYKIWTKVRTYSAIDIFYTLRYDARAKLSVVDFSPTQSYFRSRENSKVKEAEITFMPDGEIHAIRMKNKQNPQYKRFNTDNFTLDPFSAAFIARGIDWEVGKTNVFDAYNGKSRYLIKLTAKEKTTMKVNGVERPVWVINPSVEYIGKKKKSKLREAKIYMTADSYREIIEIESEVFIGSVSTELEEFEASERPYPGTQVAHYLVKEHN